MDRRAFIGCIAGGLLAVPLVAVAQQAGKTYRIGILSGARRASEVDLVRSLSDLGYVQGRNTVFESRDGEGQAEKLRAFAEELARLKVDVVITAGGPAAEAAKRATKSIPIVVWGVGDPVGSGLLTDIAHPGGNITGVTELSTELTSKRLQLLKEALPGATRIAVLWNSTDVSMNLRYREAESAAPRLGLKILPLPVAELGDFDTAFATMKRDRPDAVMIVTDPITRLREPAILEFLTANRLPSLYEFSAPVKNGALISYGPSLADLAPRVAAFVDKILRGANPGDLPLEQPTRYYLVVNLKTAKALGLTIPQSLLLRADEVIQ